MRPVSFWPSVAVYAVYLNNTATGFALQADTRVFFFKQIILLVRIATVSGDKGALFCYDSCGSE
jgi:hypothetical protein